MTYYCRCGHGAKDLPEILEHLVLTGVAFGLPADRHTFRDARPGEARE